MTFITRLFRFHLVFLALFTLPCALSAVEVDSLMQKMSDREKIGQMILVYHSPYEFLKEHSIGGVLIMADMLKTPDKLAKQLASIQKKMPVGLLVAIDQEGGKVNRLSALNEWKHVASAKRLSSLPADSITKYASRIARQLSDLHINVNLAPILDPSHNWKGEKSFMEMRDRAFGRTHEEIVPPVSAFIRGFSDRNILCISKHFPGYDVSTNSDHNIAVSDADSLAVHEYTRAFAATIGDVGGVLMSSIHFKTFCEKPSVFSPKIVGWARSLGEDKLIITDDLWGTALRSYASPGMAIHPVHYPDRDFARIVEMAFLAGNDILMITFPQKVEIMQDVLFRLVQENPDARKRLDESVHRILSTKKRMGLLKNGQ